MKPFPLRTLSHQQYHYQHFPIKIIVTLYHHHLTSPDWGSVSLTTILISVDLPAPFTPVTPTRDARHSFKLAPSI